MIFSKGYPILLWDKESGGMSDTGTGDNKGGKSETDNQDTSQQKENEKGQSAQSVLSLDDVKSAIESALSGYTKKINSEMAAHRKGIDALAESFAKFQGGSQQAAPSDQQKALEEAESKLKTMAVAVEVERTARKLNFSVPEEAMRFIDAASIPYEKVFDASTGKANPEVLEQALRTTAEKYPALLKVAKAVEDNSRKQDKVNVTQQENDRAKEFAQRFGVSLRSGQ